MIKVVLVCCLLVFASTVAANSDVYSFSPADAGNMLFSDINSVTVSWYGSGNCGWVDGGGVPNYYSAPGISIQAQPIALPCRMWTTAAYVMQNGTTWEGSGNTALDSPSLPWSECLKASGNHLPVISAFPWWSNVDGYNRGDGSVTITQITVDGTMVPEPGSMVGLVVGLVSVVGLARRRIRA